MGTVTQKIRVTGALFMGTVAQKMSQGHCLRTIVFPLLLTDTASEKSSWHGDAIIANCLHLS